MKRIACNISPIKDLQNWSIPAPTFEDMVAEEQKPITLKTSLAELAAELTELNPEKD